MCSSESLCKPSISLLSGGRWWPATLQKYKGQQKRNPLSRKWQDKTPDLNAVLWPHVCAVSHIYLYLHIGIHAHTSTHIVKYWEKKPTKSRLEVVFGSGVFKRKSGTNEVIRMVSSSWHPWLYNKTENIYCLSIWYHCQTDACAALGLIICLQDYEPQKPFTFISYQDIGILKMDQDNISQKFGKAKIKCLWYATMLQKTIPQSNLYLRPRYVFPSNQATSILTLLRVTLIPHSGDGSTTESKEKIQMSHCKQSN